MPNLTNNNSIIEELISTKLVAVLSIALIAVFILLVISIMNVYKLDKERRKLEE